MAGQHQPGKAGAIQPLEDAKPVNFKVSAENLDEALRVLKQVLEESNHVQLPGFS